MPLSKRPKLGFPDQLALNGGLKGAFCNTLTFIKLLFLFMTFLLSTFESSFYTGFAAICIS